MNLIEKTVAPLTSALVAGNLEMLHRVGLTLAGGQGLLKRGSVLYYDSAAKSCALAGTAQLETAWPGLRFYILEDDVDTKADTAVPFVGRGFGAGVFAREALVFSGTVDMDVAETVLRLQGMHLVSADM